MRCKNIRPDGKQCVLEEGHEDLHDADILSSLTHPHPAPNAAEPMVPNGDYRELQLGGSLMYILDEDQSKHFIYHMTHPKPPTPSMIEARNKMRQWKESPGNKEYDSWVRAFEKD